MNLRIMDVSFEGGKANGTAGATTPNCHTIWYGTRGEEEKYIRTDRTDKKGRVVFQLGKCHL